MRTDISWISDYNDTILQMLHEHIWWDKACYAIVLTVASHIL